MATVADLTPGDLVGQGGQEGLFITQGPHPLFPALRLVIWRLGGRWSFDALDLRQDVGRLLPGDYVARQARLRAALTGRQAPDG